MAERPLRHNNRFEELQADVDALAERIADVEGKLDRVIELLER